MNQQDQEITFYGLSAIVSGVIAMAITGSQGVFWGMQIGNLIAFIIYLIMFVPPRVRPDILRITMSLIDVRQRPLLASLYIMLIAIIPLFVAVGAYIFLRQFPYAEAYSVFIAHIAMYLLKDEFKSIL